MCISLACCADDCFNVLNCTYDVVLWDIIQDIVVNSGWIFPFEKICLVCDRPIKITLNNEDQLHNLTDTAMEYADGYSLYAHHGVFLPETYGKVHPSRWQAQWLLSEKNQELKQLLIETIGYNRIYQELPTIELDSHQGYTLLKVATDPSLEPIHLLKSYCYEPNRVRCLGIPSSILSAKEALVWVNWGMNPTKLAVLA